MSHAVRAVAAVALVVVLAACSGGGSQTEAPTTTTTAPTTTQPTTTTLSPEDQVKQAYLAYWQMVDRLIAAPDPSDAELAERATDPVLASLRDDLETRRSQGRSTRLPANSRYAHAIQSADITQHEARVSDCFIDDRIQYGSHGEVLNDRISTVEATTTLTLSDIWRVSDVKTERVGDESVGCG
jgi:hypothetical protein